MQKYIVIIPRIVNIRAHVQVHAASPEVAQELALSRLETLVDTGYWMAQGFPTLDDVQADDLCWSYEAFELDEAPYLIVQGAGGEDVSPYL